MKKRIPFIIILLTSIINAQNIDSLYNSFMSLSNPKTDEHGTITLNENPYVKCGFGIVAEVKANYAKFNEEQKNSIQKIMARPVLQKSIVSPGGFFRIHFDTTGTNVPDYFPNKSNSIQLSVDSLAMAFDSSYSFEINYLGYLSPPKDDGEGGDDLFDVYITQLGYYGVTNWNANSDNKNASYIKVDNRMNFFTKGISATRVTAAHEFHHAIQVGNYSDNLSGNTYYFELTSTSMEEFVYSSVNDYYGYLSGYFNNPDRRFTYFDGTGNGGGYDRAIWNIFLKEKFLQDENNPMMGYDIIKRSWELMRNNNTAMKSISLALSELGMSINNVFTEFAEWSFFTNHRSKENKYFPEAKNYPLIRPIAIYNYQPPKKKIMISSEPMSNNFLIFDLSSTGVDDTLVSIVSNCDLNNSDISPYEKTDFDYSLTSTAEDGSKEIVDGYYSTISSDKNEFLAEGNIFNNEVVNGGIISREEIDYAYPQPFRYSENDYLFVPTNTNQTGEARLSIYSTSMDLIFTDMLPIFKNEKVVVRWDALDMEGNRVPSGVYIFVTESDNKTVTGKIAIINK